VYSAEGDLNSADNDAKSLILTSFTTLFLQELIKINNTNTRSRGTKGFLRDFIDNEFDMYLVNQIYDKKYKG
jgi:hypothetical protein